MKKFLIYAVGVLAFTACTTKSTEKSDTDSICKPDSMATVAPAEDTVDNVTLQQPVVNKKTEGESFYISLPDIKKLAISDPKKESTYLHSLGFQGSFKEQGMEEDWQANGTFTLQEGQRKCVVKAHIDGYYQNYDITITGDDEAKEKYFNKTKKITRTKYGSPIKTKLKGNTIAVDIQDY